MRFIGGAGSREAAGEDVCRAGLLPLALFSAFNAWFLDTWLAVEAYITELRRTVIGVGSFPAGLFELLFYLSTF